MKDRRIGRFFVSEHFLELDNIAARALMAKIVVLEAEPQWHSKRVEFIALCEDFEECPEGMIPKEYMVEIESNSARIKFVPIF